MRLDYVVNAPEHFEGFFRIKCERANMYWTNHTQPPDFDRLRAWFDDVLAQGFRDIVFALSEGEVVGYMYADRVEEGVLETAIGVSERFAGQGNGTRMLRRLPELYPDVVLRAWIYAHNKASIKAHARAGYQQTSRTKIVENPATVFDCRTKVLHVRPLVRLTD